MLSRTRSGKFVHWLSGVCRHCDVGLLLVTGMIPTPVWSQAAAPSSFEAAAISAVRSGRPIPRIEITPGRLQAKAATLRYLITEAFGLGAHQLSGINGWMDSDLFSIVATAGTPLDRRQMMTLLSDFLVKRFALKFHYESRLQSVLGLIIDKRGSKLVPLRSGEIPQAPESPQGMLIRPIGTTIRDLIAHLNSRTGAASLGRPVVDQTGLEGTYRINLTFEVEPPIGGDSGRLVIDYPTALISQLGLRLEPARLDVKTLVVDSSVRPSLDQ